MYRRGHVPTTGGRGQGGLKLSPSTPFLPGSRPPDDVTCMLIVETKCTRITLAKSAISSEVVVFCELEYFSKDGFFLAGRCCGPLSVLFLVTLLLYNVFENFPGISSAYLLFSHQPGF